MTRAERLAEVERLRIASLELDEQMRRLNEVFEEAERNKEAIERADRLRVALRRRRAGLDL